MNQPRKNINIRITTEAHKALKMLCLTHSKTQAEIVERLISEFDAKKAN